MKNFRVLIVLDRFRFLFEKLGVDYDVMRKILQIKLIMDGRRVPIIIGNYKNKRVSKKEDPNNFKKSLIFYALIGLILVPIVLMGKNYVYQMSIVSGIILFMIMSSVISDFSVVLLDIRDKNILFTKPVSSATISMAKTIHIFIYMFFITISMTGPALLAGLIRHGVLFFLIFAFQILLIDLFIVVISALLYLLVLKFFDGEKLKDMINYFQIALSIGLAIGYQLVGRLFSIIGFNVVFHARWWQYLIVPVWFSGPYELLLNHNYGIHFILFSILSVLIPILSIFAYVKLMPAFEANLQKLNNNGTGKPAKEHHKMEGLVKFICPNKEERTFYKFATKMITGEREFKLKVYPSIGLAVILPFIFVFSQMSMQSLKEIGSGKMYFSMYFCGIILPTVIMMMKYSGRFKGAWIYKVMPIKNYAVVFKGTVKAIVIKLMLPLFILESALFILIFGTRIAVDLFIMGLNIWLFMVLSFSIMKKGLPFSEPFNIANQGDGLVVLPLMMLLGVFALIHFACSFFIISRIILMIVLLVLNLVLWKVVFAKVAKGFLVN